MGLASGGCGWHGSLLAAAASFDQIASYADRGHRFAEAVRDWIDRGSADDTGISPSAL